MVSPRVSVIVPVYNAAPYLNACIESILGQDFQDFELILIDDGSSDGSSAILKSCTDTRVRVFENERNLGIVKTMNRGVELARGEYIARMDADDICKSNRLQMQVDYLDKHPATAVVAARVLLIDANASDIGKWRQDDQHVTEEQIRRYLPWNNCIANQTILARFFVFERFPLRDIQRSVEDYDFYLQVGAAGLTISKLPDYLVYHRILPRSFTRGQRINQILRDSKVKLRFVYLEFKCMNINRFIVLTGFYGLLQFVFGCMKEIKDRAFKLFSN
jgi:glycosyltransferase involved in cell wall biosynthesis